MQDNVINRVGVEFAGAPGLHSFCMRDSSFSHNTIRDVTYTGISYNWYVCYVHVCRVDSDGVAVACRVLRDQAYGVAVTNK